MSCLRSAAMLGPHCWILQYECGRIIIIVAALLNSLARIVAGRTQTIERAAAVRDPTRSFSQLVEHQSVNRPIACSTYGNTQM